MTALAKLSRVRKAGRDKLHHKLHKAHHFLHLGYLISIMTESHGFHHLSVLALVMVITVGMVFGDDL